MVSPLKHEWRGLGPLTQPPQLMRSSDLYYHPRDVLLPVNYDFPGLFHPIAPLIVTAARLGFRLLSAQHAAITLVGVRGPFRGVMEPLEAAGDQRADEET